ncbi:phage portal protein [Bacillus sp. PAMC26568]|nr:phage portal protein [Bacillus sp. PAMC26568]
MMSGYTPVFSRLGSDPYTSDVVRSAIHAIATNAAKLQPKHVRRTSAGIVPINGNISRLLSLRPNEFISAFDFYYKIVTQLMIHNNAFVFLKYDDRGQLEALYPVEANHLELVESQRQLFIKFQFPNGRKITAPYEDFVHIRRFFAHSDLFGESNADALMPTLELVKTADEGIINAVKSSAFLRGLLKFTGMLKDADIRANRDTFVKDYLDVTNNGGIAALDSKAEYQELKNDPKMVDSKQLELIQDKVFRYFNINKAIVTSDYKEDQWNAFYESVLEPIAIQMSQEFTEKLFTRGEQGTGNEIIFEANRLSYASNTTKIALLRDLAPLGLFTINEGREVFNMAPVEGGDERIKTLNVVNADKADEYQLGKKPKGGETDDKEDDDAEE